MNRVLQFLFLVVGAGQLIGQGTFVFDQQDSTSEGSPPYGAFGSMQSYTRPWGQSFTPALSGIDFIRLELVDANASDGLGANVFINLLSDSISGPLLATTATVDMTNGFSGPVTFLFTSRVSLSPGVHYFFQPELASGGTWNIEAASFVYTGGNLYNNGTIYGGANLWFREGIIAPVPEPGPAALLALGTLVALVRLRRREKPHRRLPWFRASPGAVVGVPLPPVMSRAPQDREAIPRR